MAKTANRIASAGKKIKQPKAPMLRKTSNADAKGRVVLGPRFANKMFRVSEQPNGDLILEPVVTVHEREAWFYRNVEAQTLVREGIEQSRDGKGKYLGSFAEFSESSTDKEE